MPPLTQQLDPAQLAGLGVDLDQYAGLWFIDDARGLQLWQHVCGANMASHVAQHKSDDYTRPRTSYAACNSAGEIVATGPTAADTRVQAGGDRNPVIALIRLEGSLTKRGSSFSPLGSTIRFRREMRAAAVDPDVDAILVALDTPGGTVAGTHDAAMDLRKARDRKPVYTFCEDLCASAGYLIGCQGEQLFANEPGAYVGSIGVLMGLYDFSKAAEKEGVKPVVIKAGRLKGTGFPGTEITEEQQGYLQQLVDASYSQFIDAVASGRNKPRATVEQWAEGRVWPAAEAKQMGLIDGVQSLDTTLAALAARVKRGSSTSTNQPRKDATMPASFQEIVAACTGIEMSAAEDAMFVTDQLAKGVEVDAARAAWMQTLKTRTGAARQDAQQAKETAEKAAAAKAQPAPGVDPLLSSGKQQSTSAAADDTAGDAFWSQVTEKQKAGLSREKAIAAVVHDDPAAHQAMLQAYNQTHKPRN